MNDCFDLSLLYLVIKTTIKNGKLARSLTHTPSIGKICLCDVCIKIRIKIYCIAVCFIAKQNALSSKIKNVNALTTMAHNSNTLL